MPPKPKKPELFPLTIKDAITFVPKDKYITKRAEQLTKKTDGGLGVLIEKAVVKELLKFAENGTELASDQPDEMIAAYNLIQADYKAAVDHQAELLAKEEEDKLRASKEEEEKKNYELTLFNSVSDAGALANFDEIFDTSGRNRCVPREGVEVTDKQLVGALAMGFSLNDFGDWVQGDIVNQLDDRGYKNVVTAVADRFKVAPSTLYNKARVCRAVPLEQRDNLTIPFNTIATVVLAKLADEEKDNAKIQKKLLDKAQKENWTQTDARMKVREAQGKDVPAAPGEKNPRYLELNLALLTSSRFVIEKPAYSEATFVVDVKSHKFLDVQGEPDALEEVWLEFTSDTPSEAATEAEEPTPEPEPEAADDAAEPETEEAVA